MLEKIRKVLCPECGKKLDVSDLDAFFVFNCPRCGTLLRVPKKFGNYYLDRLCGSGGMGEVYLATETATGKRFALKIAMPQLADESMKCFESEYDLLHDIRHPNLAGICGFALINECAVLKMQYIAGENLYARLQTAPLPKPEEMIFALRDAVNALLTLKSFKIVHHDLKPENFILKPDGHLVICDFDLADRREDDDDSTPCRAWGSLDCASPERILSGAENYRGDIFSLGATFYEMITGRQPFADAADQQMHYDLRRKMDFPAPKTLRPEISDDFASLIVEMMSFLPENRPDYPDILARLEPR